MLDGDRAWMDIHLSTMSIMKKLFESRELFVMLAGAVFALHQDVLRAHGIDMHKTDDIVWAVAMNRIQPHMLGSFPERVKLTMTALHGIDNANLDLIEKGRPSHVPEKEYLMHALLARMRSVAARVWLLTIYSKGENSPVKLGVATIWMMLQMVKADELAQDAKIFTGTYFNGVRSDPMNLKQWQSRA